MDFVRLVLVFDHFLDFGSHVHRIFRRTRIRTVVGSRGAYPGDVLVDQPSGPKRINNPKQLKGEVASRICQSLSEASH